jgi:hypothetical protein
VQPCSEEAISLHDTALSSCGQMPGIVHGCLSLLVPDLTGRGDLRFCVELYSESKHHVFPIVYQVPFDDQLALFSLSGFDLMSLDELLPVLGLGGSGLEGSGSEQ